HSPCKSLARPCFLRWLGSATTSSQRDYLPHNFAARVAIKQQPADARQHCRMPLALCGTDLRDFPNNLSAIDIQCPQIFLRGIFFWTAYPPSASRKFNTALLKSHDVIQAGLWTKRRRTPVRPLFRANQPIFRQKLWAAVSANPAG